MKENMNNTDLLMEERTMTIEKFTDMMKDALSSCIEGCTVEAQEVKKNNGVIRHGIRIMEPENNVAPCIYLEEAFKAYQDGRSFDEIVNSVVENYEQNRVISNFDVEDIRNYEWAAQRLYCRVINTDLNRELLYDVPSVPFCDLSVVFYLSLDNLLGQGASVMVHNGLVGDWGVDKDTLFEIAKANTQRLFKGKITPMKEILKNFLGGRYDREESRLSELESCSMYVATNEMHSHGASVFLYDTLLSEHAERIGGDFYVIPSSIQEIILLPGDLDMEPEDIRKMIIEVNTTCVKPEEVLSNNVYRYSRETGLVEIA